MVEKVVMKFIQTDKAPKAIGPYSRAVRADNLIFVSGQIPIDPKTGELQLFNSDVSKQTDLVLRNLEAILSSEGLSLKNIVKTTVYLKNMDDFTKMNEVYAAHFGDHKPARACVEVSRLPKDVAVEIDAIAVTNC